MTKRDLVIDTIKSIVNEFGSDAVNGRNDIYRSRMLLSPNIPLSDDEENELYISKIVIADFRNGVKQMACEVHDLQWRSFSACDDNYIMNIAYRLCKEYKLTDKLLELFDFCGYGFLSEE